MDVPAELREVIARIEDMTALELAKENVGSLTLGIISGKDLVWTRSFGYADMEQKVMAGRSSVYRIGSISKQFTGLMLLQLVEEGKVHLSDPVEKYLPELSRVGERRPWAPPITLIQLATMTSGMDREPANLPTYL
ncbi:MAG: beta-lactamase family protein, partial [Acidobacteria bacterium]|nr:beta-lactamase family protein [Acidobacteriota bacterium]